jgi:hypothetical protein
MAQGTSRRILATFFVEKASNEVNSLFFYLAAKWRGTVAVTCAVGLLRCGERMPKHRENGKNVEISKKNKKGPTRDRTYTVSLIDCSLHDLFPPVWFFFLHSYRLQEDFVLIFIYC